MSNTATITLPAVSPGMSICVFSTAAIVSTINPNDSDRIILGDTALADGDAIEVTSGAAIGDCICLVADSADGWVTWGTGSGNWVDAN